MQKALGYHNDEDEFVAIPHAWEICACCSGNGTSSAYLGAYTWDEMQEQGDEFIEDYFAGNYAALCRKRM